MGTKRIGLARVEKLLENLKREIDWSASTTMKNLVQKTQPAFITNGDANLTVTRSTHAGKTVWQEAVTGNKTYSLPTPAAAGETYHFIGAGTGAAAEAQEIIMDFSDDACYFQGVVAVLDTNGNCSAVWGNGSSHDRFTLVNHAYYDIKLVAKSTTVMYITGYVVSEDVCTFGAQD